MTDRKFISILAGFALTVQAAFGATFYIDYDAGADSNAGTSSGAAWKHCPGDSRATGTAASTTPSAGDTLKFKGGVIYTNVEIVITYSGATNNPIVFDGNFSGDYGTGRAILDGGYVNTFAVEANAGVSWVTFKGFEIRNVGGYADDDPVLSTTCADGEVTAPPGGAGLYFGNGGNKGIHIEGNYLHRIGQWRNQEPFSGTGSVTGTGVTLIDAAWCVVTNNEFTKMRVGIKVQAETNIHDITVAGNNLHDYMVWLIDVGPKVHDAVLWNVTLTENLLHDYHQHDSGNWLGCGEKPHTDGIFFRNSSLRAYWTNVVATRNWFYADYPDASNGGTGSIFIEQGPSVTVCFNLFTGEPHTRSVGINNSNTVTNEQNVRVFNNSFYNGPWSIHTSTETSLSKRKMYWWNNIFNRDSSSTSTVEVNNNSGVNPVAMDYNIWFDTNYSATAKNVAYMAGYGYRKLAQLQAIGYDLNSHYENPQYTLLTGTPSTSDFHPQPGARALTGGTNLYALMVELGIPPVDFDGLPLPSSGEWPIGAFSTSEGVASGAPLPVSATVASDGATWSIVFDRDVTSGESGENGMSATMSLGSVTLTYSSGKGTDTLIYTGAPLRYAGETGSLSYTQPSNGLEGEDGTDVATFSGLTVVNNSTQPQPAPSGAARSLVKFKGLKIGR